MSQYLLLRLNNYRITPIEILENVILQVKRESEQIHGNITLSIC